MRKGKRRMEESYAFSIRLSPYVFSERFFSYCLFGNPIDVRNAATAAS